MGVTLRQFRKTRGKKVPELSAPLVRLFRPAGRRESGRGRTLIRITVGSSQTNSERASEARYVAGLSLYCAVAGGDFPREFPRRVCVCVCTCTGCEAELLEPSIKNVTEEEINSILFPPLLGENHAGGAREKGRGRRELYIAVF